MNWAWASSLDQIWRSPNFPMWLTLAAAGFFGIIVLITLLRAERSVANGALAVITLLAIGVAGAATVRGFGTASRAASTEARRPPTSAALPQLSCIDDLAGDAVLAACEKALFGSAEVGGCGRGLRRLADHAADLARRCRHREQGRRLRPAGAAPRCRARPLRADGLCADGARPLHAIGLPRVPLADRARARLRPTWTTASMKAWSCAMRRPGTRRQRCRRA